MRKQTAQLLSLTFFLLTSLLYSQSDKNAYVVLVSMDGFRWDYARQFNLPNLKQIAKKGVYANRCGLLIRVKLSRIIILL